MRKRRWLAELGEMRAIFKDCLPIGEHTGDMEEYFNRLEGLIYTNDFDKNPNPVDREQFDHDEPDVQYTYISDALFKERSSRPELRAHGQGVDDQPYRHPGQVPQLGGPISADPPPVPEREEFRDLEYGEQDCDNSSW
jgi:hypothetical protein